MLRLFSVLTDLPNGFVRDAPICILRTHAAVRITIDEFSHAAVFASSALSKCFTLLILF